MLGHLARAAGGGGRGRRERRLSELPLLAEAERRQVAGGVEPARRQLPGRGAAAPAVRGAGGARARTRWRSVCEGRALTYGELDARANRLARHLLRPGRGPGARAWGSAWSARWSWWSRILAVLKAGGAYVPLDPRYPPSGCAFMLADAGAPVLVTQESLLGRAAASRPCRCSAWSGRPRRSTRRARTTLGVGVSPEQPGLRHLHLGLDRPAQGGGGQPRATSRACSRATERVVRLRRGATCGRCSTPTPSTSRSGSSGARCSTAAGWWWCRTGSAARREAFLRAAGARAGDGAEPDAVGVPPADAGARRRPRLRRSWRCAA